jgi:hypothetical protein
LRKVLIISPHFPPVNAPDMQRVRMSIPYYKELGWEPVVLCVDDKLVTGYKDELLKETVPCDIEIHKVGAWSEETTRRFGIGSLSLRSYYHFKKAGTELLKKEKYDLVFFSTSLFHVCALGRYWQKRFGVPFIIDMQDPWRNDFFLNKPLRQRPPKFWLSYTLDKRMEAYTLPYAAGLMSVSQAYIDNLRKRYRSLLYKPALLLPFGVSVKDFELVEQKHIAPEIIGHKKINVVYMGAVNKFFLPLINAFFIAFKNTVENLDAYHFYFIGTNYSPAINQKPVEKIARELKLESLVTEEPQRIPYFSALSTIMHADILFIPGSSDSDYNASKVYNNIFSGKPIFSIFNEKSLVKEAINDTDAGIVVSINEEDTQETLVNKIEKAMPEFTRLHLRKVPLRQDGLKKYLANTMAEQQVRFFNKVLSV